MASFKEEEKNGSFSVTKNLWALGQYSLFVRPGMQRLIIKRTDRLDDMAAAQKTMVSAYIKGKRLVVVAINYTRHEQPIQLQVANHPPVKTIRRYTTSAAENDNMRASVLTDPGGIVLPARSISTFVMD